MRVSIEPTRGPEPAAQPEYSFIIIQGGKLDDFNSFPLFVQHYATLIVVFATNQHHFAFAQNGVLGHTECAFQASSPKTSTARSATIGPFFVPIPLPVSEPCRRRFASPGMGTAAARMGWFEIGAGDT
ncbi:hypothetical protein [Novosphingobium sp. BL-52-GroH]|uniref:hypothetical protein n=1 Tax=Novosphingobium sp. BL-52-GroH TaxID=3349877 RepID=UPI003850A1DE